MTGLKPPMTRRVVGGWSVPPPTDWYRHAVMYQVRVDCFADGSGNGHGDLLGLIARIDHFAKLGADCIWLSPITESPARDGGYDPRHLTRVDRRFGSDETFVALIEACHAKGIKVVIDFVANHTSIDHAWFQQESCYKVLQARLRQLFANAAPEQRSRAVQALLAQGVELAALGRQGTSRTLSPRVEQLLGADVAAATPGIVALITAFLRSPHAAAAASSGYHTVCDQLARVSAGALGDEVAQEAADAGDFYIWSADASNFREACVAFPTLYDSVWARHEAAANFVYHSFYDHQVDLNYRNPKVRQCILDVMHTWVERGVDGLRIDAAPFLWKEEGTRCLSEGPIHEIFRQWRQSLAAAAPHVMLLAEAVETPERLLPYFGQGDEFHMAYNFPLMSHTYLALARQSASPLRKVLTHTAQLPPGCQWATFLRSHDELSVERLHLDEQADVLRRFAPDLAHRVHWGIRRRLAPMLENDLASIQLAVGLLLSMPGTPILYYGDEIAMGDRFTDLPPDGCVQDRDAVRTPMQWDASSHGGFSRSSRPLKNASIEGGEYGFPRLSVAQQEQDPHSLFHWHRRAIAARRSHDAFAVGTLQLLDCENGAVLAFVREHLADRVLVAANISAQPQRAKFVLPPAWHHHPTTNLLDPTSPLAPRVPSDGVFDLTLEKHAFVWLTMPTA